jgi:hypothetical protein
MFDGSARTTNRLLFVSGSQTKFYQRITYRIPWILVFLLGTWFGRSVVADGCRALSIRFISRPSAFAGRAFSLYAAQARPLVS